MTLQPMFIKLEIIDLLTFRFLKLILIVSICFLFSGCSKNEKITSMIKNIGQKEEKITKSDNQQIIETQPSQNENLQEKYVYNANGRRDPFVQQDIEEEEFGLLSFSPDKDEGFLNGCIKSSGSYIALVNDNKGKSYILHEGDRVKNGVVYKISHDEVTFLLKPLGGNISKPFIITKEESDKRKKDINKRTRNLQDNKS